MERMLELRLHNYIVLFPQVVLCCLGARLGGRGIWICKHEYVNFGDALPDRVVDSLRQASASKRLPYVNQGVVNLLIG